MEVTDPGPCLCQRQSYSKSHSKDSDCPVPLGPQHHLIHIVLVPEQSSLSQEFNAGSDCFRVSLPLTEVFMPQECLELDTGSQTQGNLLEWSPSSS